MRRMLLLLGACAAALVLPTAAHAICYGVVQPTGNVCGDLYRLRASGWKEAGPSTVLLCPRGSKTNCKGAATTLHYDGWGRPVQNFTIAGFVQYYGYTGYRDFDIYLYGNSSTDYWGSPDAVHGVISIGQYGLDTSFAMVPRPLPPTPVYPTGTSVPNNYTVRWKSGLDADRTRYPTTYQVWFKYWPFGGTEPANWSLSAAGLPCHSNGSGPDINNECSTYVAGPQSEGNWKWYVIADANVSSVIVNPSVAVTYFSTQSPSVSFVQPNP